ncbi:MAG TPA: ABC transporter ATP-binding protein [Dehalococcoidia bacterium]|jgi:oligopeptide/dipeptide ABC transporter ATP-binding protein|nr:ABC transporter ATP-binding protein [Dehalococcoidia bacterium]
MSFPSIHSDGDPILRIEGLRTAYHDRSVVTKAVDGVSLELRRGEVLGIVGESGCGKSTLGLSILNLIPHPGYIDEGAVYFNGRNVLEMSGSEMRDLRGRDISMIFQDPVAGLNPTLSIGEQVQEIITAHTGAGKREAHTLALELLSSMGLADPERIAIRYPFQLSGGMAQRVMIATAMALKPAILIADEPTSALDMTVQAQILEELRRLRNQGVSILLITHDFGVIAQMADRVAVMYAGRIAEEGETDDIFARPQHPYTAALLASLPRLHYDVETLHQVQGRPPDMSKLPAQCAFVPRCTKVRSDCRVLDSPALEEVEPRHWVACYNPVYHPDPDDEED